MTTCETGRKQATEARVFRRAPAVREVVAGPPVHAVSATCPCPPAAVRKGVQRFAPAGPQGVPERPRPGRPRPVTDALDQPLHRLVDPDP
jgi:hypothetical protein